MFRQMKKAGIIGGLEFIGSYITLKFLSENYHVKVPVSKYKVGKQVLGIPGISANNYLEKFYGDLNDLFELRKFVSDCDIIIHCGSPARLNQMNEYPQLYVPQISKTGSLLKILDEFPNLQKIIFISPPASMTPNSPLFQERNVKTDVKNSGVDDGVNLQFRKAEFHARKAQENVFQTFYEKRFEVILVSPAKVAGNALISSNEITSSGLKLLFEKEINHDPVFKRILQQTKLKTLINAEDVAEEVFSKVSSAEITEKEIYSTAW